MVFGEFLFLAPAKVLDKLIVSWFSIKTGLKGVHSFRLALYNEPLTNNKEKLILFRTHLFGWLIICHRYQFGGGSVLQAAPCIGRISCSVYVMKVVISFAVVIVQHRWVQITVVMMMVISRCWTSCGFCHLSAGWGHPWFAFGEMVWRHNIHTLHVVMFLWIVGLLHCFAEWKTSSIVVISRARIEFVTLLVGRDFS